MARSNKNNSKSTTPKSVFDKYEFINYRLNSAEKEHCEKWCETADIHIPSTLTELCSDGYKFSVSYSEKLEAATATLTNQNADAAYQGKIVSIRARDAASAIMRLFWLHFILAETDWNNLTQEVTGDIW